MICLKICKWNKHIRHTSIQKCDKNTNKIPTFSYFKDRKIPTFSYFGLKIPTFSYFFDLSYHFQPCAGPRNVVIAYRSKERDFQLLGTIYIQRLRHPCVIAPKCNLLFWCCTVTPSDCNIAVMSLGNCFVSHSGAMSQRHRRHVAVAGCKWALTTLCRNCSINGIRFLVKNNSAAQAHLTTGKTRTISVYAPIKCLNISEELIQAGFPRDWATNIHRDMDAVVKERRHMIKHIVEGVFNFNPRF